MFKNIIAALRGKALPMNEVIVKAAFFLRPQLLVIAERFENKYAVITGEGLAYAVCIGEEIAGRFVRDEELRDYLVGVLGEDYEMRVDQILGDVERNYGPSALKKIRLELRKIATEDVRGGMLHCSNFLVVNAELIDDNIQATMAQIAADNAR